MSLHTEFDLKLLNNFLSALRAESSLNEWETFLKEDEKISSLVERLNRWYVSTREEKKVAILEFSKDEFEYLASPFLDRMRELEGIMVLEEVPRSKKKKAKLRRQVPILVQLSVKGYLDLFQWFISEFRIDLYDYGPGIFFDNASQAGHLPLAQWIYTEYQLTPEVARNIFSRVCTRGHLEVVKWLYSLGFEWTWEVGQPLADSSEHGQFEIVKWLCQNAPNAREEISDAFLEACDGGYSDIAHWLYDFDPIQASQDIRETFVWTCESGHLEIVQWLWSLGHPIAITSLNDNLEDMTNLELVKWLVETCNFNPNEESISRSLIFAINQDRVDLAEYLFGLWVKRKRE